MRIRAFWAQGFRSLLDVRLEGLGAFNVFYGANGAGKSNILAALDVLVKTAALRISRFNDPDEPIDVTSVGSWVSEDDFCHVASAPLIRLGVTLVNANGGPVFGQATTGYRASEVSFELVFERLAGRGIGVRVGSLSDSESGNLLDLWRPQPAHVPRLREIRDGIERWFDQVIGQASYRLVPAIRAFHPESGELRTKERASLSDLFAAGRIKEAFVLALTSPDPVVRRRFTRLRELLVGEPLRRPPFDPVYDPQTQRFELRESASGAGTRDVPLDLAGLGIQQIYAVLGQILLDRAFAVGIEEPEAHLHAPTSGKHLRVLLRRLVEQGDVQQLFIATHSNLFDLDRTGYYDVRLDHGVTVVERKTNLSEIDRLHLYEPGPAKHGLIDLLTIVEPTTTVLRRPDGTAVTAEQMLGLLQEDAPEAFDFLRDVHGAAVRAVQIRAGKKP